MIRGSQVASLESMQNFGGYFAGSLAPVITGWIVQTTYSYLDFGHFGEH